MPGWPEGADVILIPEIEFSYESICDKIREREALGKHFTIVVVAEGARQQGGDFVTAACRPPTTAKRGSGESARWWLRKSKNALAKSRVLRPRPSATRRQSYDLRPGLCSVFGAHAVELIAADDFGKMVAFQGASVIGIPISEAVGKLKTVRPDGSFARTARALGICLGD